jgi:hypothetical protein
VPVWHDSGQPEGWEQPRVGVNHGANHGANQDAWWSMETMQRRIEQDYGRLAGPPQAIFASLEAETLAAVRGLAADAGAAERSALTQSIARRQQAACQIIDEVTKACVAEIVTPRSDDPRGSYLDRVEAERLAMSRGEFGDDAPMRRASTGR